MKKYKVRGMSDPEIPACVDIWYKEVRWFPTTETKTHIFLHTEMGDEDVSTAEELDMNIIKEAIITKLRMLLAEPKNLLEFEVEL